MEGQTEKQDAGALRASGRGTGEAGLPLCWGAGGPATPSLTLHAAGLALGNEETLSEPFGKQAL